MYILSNRKYWELYSRYTWILSSLFMIIFHLMQIYLHCFTTELLEDSKSSYDVTIISDSSSTTVILLEFGYVLLFTCLLFLHCVLLQRKTTFMYLWNQLLIFNQVMKGITILKEDSNIRNFTS